jgi:hypothetical protein
MRFVTEAWERGLVSESLEKAKSAQLLGEVNGKESRHVEEQEEVDVRVIHVVAERVEPSHVDLRHLLKEVGIGLSQVSNQKPTPTLAWRR